MQHKTTSFTPASLFAGYDVRVEAEPLFADVVLKRSVELTAAGGRQVLRGLRRGERKGSDANEQSESDADDDNNEEYRLPVAPAAMDSLLDAADDRTPPDAVVLSDSADQISAELFQEVVALHFTTSQQLYYSNKLSDPVARSQFKVCTRCGSI